MVQDTSTALYFWGVNIPATTGCKWSSISSTKFTAAKGIFNFTIALWNGDTEDGNDLVLDDVRLVKISPPAEQPSFNYELVNVTRTTYGIRLGSKQNPPLCKDNFYIRSNNGLFALVVANITIKTKDEYTYTGLLNKTPYEIGIKRVCDCNEDSFWRFSFNLNFEIPAFANALDSNTENLRYDELGNIVPSTLPSNLVQPSSAPKLSAGDQSNAPFDI